MTRPLRRRRQSLISQIRQRLDDMEDRLELIEDDLGINSFMADDNNVGVGSTASDNVGVGSTAPSGTTQTDPDTSVDGEQAAPNVGDGSTATSEPADPDFS